MLPPNCPKSALSRVKPQDRDDAIQEAWVAYLEGKNPAKAIEKYRKAEAYYHQKMVTNHDFGSDD